MKPKLQGRNIIQSPIYTYIGKKSGFSSAFSHYKRQVSSQRFLPIKIHQGKRLQDPFSKAQPTHQKKLSIQQFYNLVLKKQPKQPFILKKSQNIKLVQLSSKRSSQTKFRKRTSKNPPNDNPRKFSLCIHKKTSQRINRGNSVHLIPPSQSTNTTKQNMIPTLNLPQNSSSEPFSTSNRVCVFTKTKFSPPIQTQPDSFDSSHLFQPLYFQQMVIQGPLSAFASRQSRKAKRGRIPLKESSWDNRFHLGRIPKYNAQNDKYAQQFIQIRKKNVLFCPGRIRKAKVNPSGLFLKSESYKRIHNQKPPFVKNSLLKKAVEELNQVWEQKKIDQQFRVVYLNAFDRVSLKFQVGVILKEIQELKNDKNVIQRLEKSVADRENLIHKLLVMGESQMEEAGEILVKLRIISVLVVECVQEWRKKLSALYSLRPGNIEYCYKGENYLIKMKTDLQFLFYSPLAKVFQFSKAGDTFLLFFGQNQPRFSVADPLMKRIKFCENILINETIQKNWQGKVRFS